MFERIRDTFTRARVLDKRAINFADTRDTLYADLTSQTDVFEDNFRKEACRR